MIEKDLGRIADALEQLVARFQGVPVVDAPVEDPPTPKAKPAQAPPVALTLDALRKGLAPIDPEQGRALLGQFGVKKLSEIQPEQYAAVLAAAQELQ